KSNRTGSVWHENVQVFPDYRNVDVIGTHAYIAEMEWALLAEIDESEALAPVYSMQNTLILILTCLALVGIGFSFVVSRSISKPIRQLTHAAEKIGKGDLTTEIDVESTDDVGVLAKTLTRMRGDLKASREEIEMHSQTLERRVAERTKELEARQNELDEKVERLRRSEAASLNIMEDLNEAFEYQKRAEERISRQNLVLQAIREVDQLIAREKDRDNLISGACSNLINTRGYDGAWIALKEESGDLISTAEAGFGDSFVDLELALTGDRALHCAELVMDKPGVVVIEDPPESCLGCPLSNVHQGNASMAKRLESGWKVFGMMCVSASPEVVIDEEELALFEEVAMDISFALYTIELEEKRKRMEVNLRESEEKYRALFESSPDGILIADINAMEFKYANPAISRMLGYSREELENMSLVDIHPEGALDNVISEFVAQARGEKVLAEDIPCIRKDGDVIRCDISTAKALVDGSECNIGFFRDTTERNRMIEDLEATNEELRATQSHLIQSEKLASIGMLASGIAHEINNPLAAIAGYAEAIMDEDDVKLQTDYAAKILSASGRASEVVRWLSKHSRDAKVDTVGDVQLNDVLNDSLESVRLAKPSLDIEIQKDFGDIPLIEGNNNEIQQIFVNLINNATDAMLDGGRLLISTSTGEGYVKATISDTGGGIPKDHLTKIFDPFFTTKEVGEGTGLGLYVTSMIVLRHQGRMEVESEVGKGTIFTVRFPIKAEMTNLDNNMEPAQAGV
ncbi:MAG: ATP-binding protein, partial [Thermoplasmata archaeon]